MEIDVQNKKIQTHTSHTYNKCVGLDITTHKTQAPWYYDTKFD